MSFLALFLIKFILVQSAHAVYFPTNETVFDLSSTLLFSEGFKESNDGLIVLSEGDSTKQSYFIPKSSQYVHGIVRSIITLGSDPDVNINFRCQNTHSLYPCYSTYRINLSINGIHFQSKKHGNIVKDIPIELSATELEKVEVVVSSFMDTHQIFIYNTWTGEKVRSLFVQDSDFHSGFVGIDASPNQNSNTVVNLLGLDVSEEYAKGRVTNQYSHTHIHLDKPNYQTGEWIVDDGLTFTEHNPNSRYNVWASSLSSYSNGTLTANLILGSKPDFIVSLAAT